MRSGLLSRWGWSLSLIAALVGSTAQGANLRWKLKVGDSLRYEMSEKRVTSVLTGGAEVSKVTLTQTVDLTWSVKDVESQGSANLTHTIDRVRIKIESPQGSIDFDSKDEKGEGNPLKTLFKVLVGKPFSFKMDPQGALSDVKVPQNVARILKELGGAAGGADQIFSEEGLKTMITQSSVILPKEEISTGKSWTQEVKIPAPPLGSMVLAKTYRFEGESPENGMAKIGIDAKFTLQSVPGVDVPFKIQSQASKGEISFDNAVGRLTSSSLNEKLEQVGKIQDKEFTQITDSTVSMKLLPLETAKPK